MQQRATVSVPTRQTRLRRRIPTYVTCQPCARVPLLLQRCMSVDQDLAIERYLVRRLTKLLELWEPVSASPCRRPGSTRLWCPRPTLWSTWLSLSLALPPSLPPKVHYVHTYIHAHIHTYIHIHTTTGVQWQGVVGSFPSDHADQDYSSY
jgi:hypothetical protein